MTRLFIRFYIGVIVILITALVIHTYVFQQSDPRNNAAVIEQALSGGVRGAIDRLNEASPNSFDATLASIQSRFEYPVQLISIRESPLESWARRRLSEKEVVLYAFNGGIHVAAVLEDAETALTFGPLPSFTGPSQLEISLGVGIVLLLSAIAIAILLRPVVQQLRAVERTAGAIAEGDLSTRIDSKKVSGLNIAKAFNTMASRTEGLLKSQRELLQAVSHELRTPLAKIRFATDLIESSTTQADRQEKLAAVDRATEELDGLVGELLDYARMESQDNSDRFEPIDLRDALDEIIDTRRPLFASIEFDVRCDRETRVLGDRNALLRAIGNLVGNAGKYARSRVKICVEQGGRETVVRVEDDGPGIPEAERRRIFDPFVRLENSAKHGAGLGLALVAADCR